VRAASRWRTFPRLLTRDAVERPRSHRQSGVSDRLAGPLADTVAAIPDLDERALHLAQQGPLALAEPGAKAHAGLGARDVAAVADLGARVAVRKQAASASQEVVALDEERSRKL